MPRRNLYAVALAFDDEQTVNLPAGAEILTATVQGDTPTLWIVADLGATPAPRTIIMRQPGSGAEPIPSFAMTFLGILQEAPGRPNYAVFVQALPTSSVESPEDAGGL